MLDTLVTPLQDKMEDWKKTAAQLDKDHSKGLQLILFVVVTSRKWFHRVECHLHDVTNLRYDEIIANVYCKQTNYFSEHFFSAPRENKDSMVVNQSSEMSDNRLALSGVHYQVTQP
jgi:hypothetical protein